MNRYKVTMSYWNGEGRERKVIFFDASAFDIMDTQSGPVALFTSSTGKRIGAAHGFDCIELFDPESEKEKLQEHWARTEPPGTLAA